MKREKRSKPSRAAYLLLRAAMLQSQRQLLHARESNDFIEAKSLLKPGRPTKPSCECRLSDGAMVAMVRPFAGANDEEEEAVTRSVLQ